METQRTSDGAASPLSEETPSSAPAPDVDSKRRLQTLEGGLERLEHALEGLQDALYRHEVLQDRTNGELRRRTEQLARDLGGDARRGGL